MNALMKEPPRWGRDGRIHSFDFVDPTLDRNSPAFAHASANVCVPCMGLTERPRDLLESPRRRALG
jgi:hypothetical protein